MWVPLRPRKASNWRRSASIAPACYDEGAVEISAYDPDTARAFVTLAARPRVDVIDLSNPARPSLAFRIDLTTWGADAHATSVAVRAGVSLSRFLRAPKTPLRVRSCSSTWQAGF